LGFNDSSDRSISGDGRGWGGDWVLRDALASFEKGRFVRKRMLLPGEAQAALRTKSAHYWRCPEGLLKLLGSDRNRSSH
jgi:hypothetical protein